jgi:large subunit ribosomal protein L30
VAKAAKTIKVEQTGSAIRRHHSQRSTLIKILAPAKERQR